MRLINWSTESTADSAARFQPVSTFDSLVQFSSVKCLDRLDRRADFADNSADYLPVFPAGGNCEQFWHGHGCPLSDVFIPAFPLPTTASPTQEVPSEMILKRLL